MKFNLTAVNYSDDGQVTGFVLVKFPLCTISMYSVNQVKDMLKQGDTSILGLGLSSDNKLIGTCGKLERYTRLLNGKPVVNTITILSKIKDKYLVCLGYRNLTKLGFSDIINILNSNNTLNSLSNARIINKNIIPIRNTFYVGYLNHQGGVLNGKDDRRECKTLDRERQKERQGEPNSSRENSISTSRFRKAGFCKGDSGIYFHDGLGLEQKVSPEVLSYLSVNKFKPKTNAETFARYISSAKECNRHGACVDLHSDEEYRSMNCLSFDNGKAGVAIHDGNITSVFKHDSSTIKGFIKLAMISAILSGGEKLDCYSINGMLPSMYAECGMIPVCRVAFNKEFAPPDWDYKVYGEPDIVFMVYCGDDINTLYKNYGKYKSFASYSEDEVPLIEDLSEVCAYDLATAIRDYRLAQLKVRRYLNE